MKEIFKSCANCKHIYYYITGSDEYPIYTTIVNCSLGICANCNTEEIYDIVECKDF